MNYNPMTPLLLALFVLVCGTAWDYARRSK